MQPSIRVQNLSKRYRIGVLQRKSYRTLRETLMDGMTWPYRRFKSLLRGEVPTDLPTEWMWALKDVAFDLDPGEVVGIVGRNGAGKSTLLKILSRITEPTSGRVELRGRVVSLLEVGTGFHYELTGRENIFLNGVILGMRYREIRKRFDDIVQFSEVEKFLDTPVKHYSSGMFVRLAFAVAAHLDPEILLVDEVLAVGDAAFQKKCMGKMSTVAREGRTVLFVSHNLTAVRSLCKTGIWLDQGKVVREGTADDVVDAYILSHGKENRQSEWPSPEKAPGTDQARLKAVRIVPRASDPVLSVDDDFDIEMEFWNRSPDARWNACFVVYNEENVCVFNTFNKSRCYPAGVVAISCRIPAHLLNDGYYHVHVMLVENEANVHVSVPNVVALEIADGPRQTSWHGKFPGVVRPMLEWTESANPISSDDQAVTTPKDDTTAPETPPPRS